MKVGINVKYNSITEEEYSLINTVVINLINNKGSYDFTGTTLSPYNIDSYFLSAGWDSIYDVNSTDAWYYFTKSINNKEVKLVLSCDYKAYSMILANDED